MNHGSCPRPTAFMVHHSQRQGIQQSADIISNKVMQLKLKFIIINSID